MNGTHASAPADPNKARCVFIVHGRNVSLAAEMQSVLRSLGLQPMSFSDVRQSDDFRGRYIGDVLEHAFRAAQAVVILMNGEEKAVLRPQNRLPKVDRDAKGFQPRPNVLVEIGMALQSHRDRVVIVQFPPLRPITDLSGLVTVEFGRDTDQFTRELANELRQAGCTVGEIASSTVRISDRALGAWREGALLRFLLPQVLLLLISAATVAGVWVWLVRPNWCGDACRSAQEQARRLEETAHERALTANAHYHAGTALWTQANANPGAYSALYRKALEEYQKALFYDPTNLTYRPSIAATLNDLGEYQRTVAEIEPSLKSKDFEAHKNVWLIGELAAAYAMLGDSQAALKYTDLAASFQPHFRDWVKAQQQKYRNQDQLRSKSGG